MDQADLSPHAHPYCHHRYRHADGQYNVGLGPQVARIDEVRMRSSRSSHSWDVQQFVKPDRLCCHRGGRLENSRKGDDMMNEKCDCVKEERQAERLDRAGTYSYKMLPSNLDIMLC